MKNTTTNQTTAANLVTVDNREAFKQELWELANQAYCLAFFESRVRSSRCADLSAGGRNIGLFYLPGKSLPTFIDIDAELKNVRKHKASLGRQLLPALEQAQGCLSLEEFCNIFVLDVDDACYALREYDPAAGGWFTWLIFEYGIESVDSEGHEGILFECILESVLAEIRNSSALRGICRQKASEILQNCKPLQEELQ